MLNGSKQATKRHFELLNDMNNQRASRSAVTKNFRKIAGKIDASSMTDKLWHCVTGLLFVTALSSVTRFYRIGEPAHVCWDETHFGKMASWYINRTMFFDVHPPLGKMLIALGGVVSGYNGSFPFEKPGDLYPHDVPYVRMRTFCAFFGVSLIPLAYGIVWQLTNSTSSAFLAAFLLISDTGLLTLSQYILLDPFLLFFIMSSVFCYLRFTASADRPFSGVWWLWLILTGLGLACAISVKFVGLFVILLIGISTVGELWRLLGDLSQPLTVFVKHFVARFLCLVVIPVFIYVSIFYVHLCLLSHSGSADGFFSSAFQSQLIGNALHNATMPEYAAYGSVITLKNHRTGGSYLHSHTHLYPDGAGTRQQQVTAYSHKDENNRWLIKPSTNEANVTHRDEPVYLRNGDLLILEHLLTGRNLHSHRVSAPVTKRHFQVSCYGMNGTGDANDIFRVEVPGMPSGTPLRAVQTVFRIVHVNVGCALYSHDKQLPLWGWEQLEVTCNPNVRHPDTLWNIEQLVDSSLENRSFEIYKLSFWQKFVEFHTVMFRGNKGLKPKEGEITSLPWQWPVNYRGQPFSGPEYRVYLLGNPVIWWFCLFSLLLFVVASVCIAVVNKHHSLDASLNASRSQFVVLVSSRLSAGRWLLLAWFLHYAPFWLMGRVLYFHHYFAAQIFSVMLTAVLWDVFYQLFIGHLKPSRRWWIRHMLIGVMYGSIAYSFFLFRHLSYGMTGPLSSNETSQVYGLRWLESWDI